MLGFTKIITLNSLQRFFTVFRNLGTMLVIISFLYFTSLVVCTLASILFIPKSWKKLHQIQLYCIMPITLGFHQQWQVAGKPSPLSPFHDILLEMLQRRFLQWIYAVHSVYNPEEAFYIYASCSCRQSQIAEFLSYSGVCFCSSFSIIVMYD